MFFGKDELSLVAFVAKTHGVTGNLVLTIHNNIPNNIINEKSAVFLFKQGIPIPFFVESVKVMGINNVIKFKHIDSIEKANFFVGCDVYVLSHILKSGNTDNLSCRFCGFSVFDKQYGFIGKISSFEIIPGNPVFETDFEGKSIIIPYTESIILKIDNIKKEIYIDAPLGLIDIYLQE